jgi:septum formation protein
MTHMNQSGFPMVILASASPRRRELFEEAGIRHIVCPSSVDDGELHSGNVDPEQWVGSLAYYKAAATAEGLEESSRGGSVVLGADTVCVYLEEIIGQPADRADAKRIISRMAGQIHDVLTGVAILDPATGQREIFIDRSEVTLGELSETQIDEYLDSGNWKGKAGGYNITERLAAGWPIEFDGDETSIVGLPMTRTLERIAAFG